MMLFKYRLVTLLLFVTLWIYIFYEIKQSSMIILGGEFEPVCKYKIKPMYKPYYNFHNDTIHIAMLLAGGIDNCNQAETLIKSILFHQKRWYSSKHDDCCNFKYFTQFNSNWLQAIDRVQSFKGSKSKRLSIVFHFIVDQLPYEFMYTLMSDWTLDGISVQFYQIKNYEERIKSFKSSHPTGHKNYLKLLITQILPNEIRKVIVLNTDILLNDDISNLWSLFDEFNKDQCIGIAAEQNPTFYSNMGQRFWPTLGYGYNSGILLIHLTKLRARGWDEIWMKTAFNLIEEKRILPTGEQDVINAVLNKNKQWLYELPCKWNIQLSAFSIRERCPVVWEFLMNNNDNYRREKALHDDIVLKYPNAKLIHFNAHVEPEYFFPIPLRFPLPNEKSDEYHSTIQLSRKYFQLYYNLRSMSRHCFL
ncbi:unnamed protein product [Schistosoma rodhaini]|uniref:Glycosyltransferase-like protein LARGE1 n=1 Tax=Schistosoma mansoni TaxID=6183 RepID=A0A5K4FC65_SCHMA|nr:unnamed protein product [Schistosoma rodhaini]